MSVPKTIEIKNTIFANLTASLGQIVSTLFKSFFDVLANTLAALLVSVYRYSDFYALQVFARHAVYKDVTIGSKTINPLVELGAQNGTGQPKSATRAELLIDITVNQTGGSLPSSTQLVGDNNGVVYLTIGSVLLNNSVVQATIRAVNDQSGGDGSGVISNLDPGDTVSFVSPPGTLEKIAIVDSQTVTGANAEGETPYRSRVVSRGQKRPEGGAYSDYWHWGIEVEGIIGIFPYTGEIPGVTVDIYVEATPESSGDPDGIPTQAQLDAVEESTQLDDNGLASRRPIGVIANTIPITRIGFDVKVTGITQVDDLAQVQSDITTAITQYFLDRQPFIPGLDFGPRADTITRSAVSGVVDDIVSAASGLFGTVSIEQNGSGIESYTLQEGELSKMASIAF